MVFADFQFCTLGPQIVLIVLFGNVRAVRGLVFICPIVQALILALFYFTIDGADMHAP